MLGVLKENSLNTGNKKIATKDNVIKYKQKSRKPEETKKRIYNNSALRKD